MVEEEVVLDLEIGSYYAQLLTEERVQQSLDADSVERDEPTIKKLQIDSSGKVEILFNNEMAVHEKLKNMNHQGMLLDNRRLNEATGESIDD